MSDSIENQINQYTLEQNNSPQVPSFRSKKSKNKILAAIALIMLLAVGAISSFILLGQKQDTRNQASVAQGLVNIKLQKNVDCAIGKTCYVNVIVNTGSSNIDALQAKVVFDQNSIGSVDSIIFKPAQDLQTTITSTPTPTTTRKTCQTDTDCTSGQICYQPPMPTCPEGRMCPQVMVAKYCVDRNAKYSDPVVVSAVDSGATNAGSREAFVASNGSGISFEENQRMESSRMIGKPMLSLAKNEVSPNKEILLAWTLMSASVPFNTNGSDYLLGRIEFVAKQSFKSGDSTNNMTISLDQSFSKATLYKTGQDSLNTPSPLTIALNMGDTTERIRCKSDDGCPTGQYCYYEPTPSGVQNFMANAYCKEKITKPGVCQTDADCAKNEYCYQPPMPACPEGAMCKMVMPAKTCKERSVSVSPTKVPTATPTLVASVTPSKIICKTNAACPTGQYCYQEPAPICPEGRVCPTFKAIESYCKDIESKPGVCMTDADCAKGQTCYQPPMATCPEGKVCPQVMPAKYCKESVVTKTPTPVVSVSVKPSATPTPISCAIPDCKNGVLKMIASKYDATTSSMAGMSCPIYVCEEVASCQYDYSVWSECSYGVQARTISNLDKVGCSAPILKRSCDKPCSSDSNCSAGEVCIKKQAPQTTVQEGARITSMGYCSAKPALSYDLNGDGAVNVLDLSIVIKNLFTNNANADVNKDNVVDIADYSLVLKSLISREPRIAY